MTRQRKALTIIELLTATAVIAVVCAICFPLYSSAVKEGRKSVKTAQLRQLSMALLEYTESNNGSLPLFPYGTGTEWHNIILAGPINKLALSLANPDKADIRTKSEFSYHLGYSINQCLMRSEYEGIQISSLNPYLIFQATELKTPNSFTIHKTWHLGCHDKQYAQLHNLVPTDGRLLADIDDGGSLAAKSDGSIKWDSYKLFMNKPCTCAYSGLEPETPFHTFHSRS